MKFLTEYSATEQVALRTEICPDATDDQINYYLRVAQSRGVDPFSGLLYMQRRFNKQANKWKCSVQPTVDGSRFFAARAGEYAGSDEPEFDSEDGDTPKWCRVTVYRQIKGSRCAFTAKCRFKEFVPAPPNDFQWKSKPYHMLSKVTEVQALRKGFPESVPAAGEDDYDDEIVSEPAQSQEDKDRARLAVEWSNAVRAFEELGKKESDLKAYLKEVFGDDTISSEKIDSLRIWYEELKCGK